MSRRTKCPTCGRVYTDESLSFCLEDGAPLLFDSGTGDARTAIFDLQDIDEGTTKRFVTEDRKTSFVRASNRKWIFAIGSVILLAAAGTAAYFYFSDKSNAARVDSIAVLPFRNETGSTETEYLSDGMTELLIGKLSQLSGLSVKARSSVFRYKGNDLPPARIAEELRVDALLMGRFSGTGDRFVFNLELVDAGTENVIWSEQYARSSAELSNLQNTIAADVANKLNAKLSGASEQSLARKDTTNPEAYENYLRGRFHWNKRSRDGLELSIEYFERAIAADPGYAAAFSGLAETYSLMPFYAGADTQDSSSKARAAALRAIEIHPNAAEPHAVLGFIKKWYELDGAGAEAEFKRAVELNANYSTGHHWYALYLATRGRHDEALAEIRRAFELDPFSVGINLDIGVVNFYARRYDETAAQLRKTLEMDPSFLQIHLFLAENLEQQQRYEEAADAWVNVVKTAGGDPSTVSGLKGAFQSGGVQGFYQHKLKVFLQRWERRGEGAFGIAEVYSRLGETEKAFEWLNKSFEIRDLSLSTLGVTPGFDNIRSDPRFERMLRKAGL